MKFLRGVDGSVGVGSLPSRERGLKSRSERHGGGRMRSLPSRERGLKFHLVYGCIKVVQSLPSRERGLKFLDFDLTQGQAVVAPFTGAWIEILKMATILRGRILSLPSRERGLKYAVLPCRTAGYGRRSLHGSVD